MESYSNYIGGKWVDAPRTDTIRLPFDGTPVATVPHGGAEHLTQAVAVAQEGARAMAALSNAERADMLLRIRTLLARDVEDFARLISSETGKPIKQSGGDHCGELFELHRR